MQLPANVGHQSYLKGRVLTIKNGIFYSDDGENFNFVPSKEPKFSRQTNKQTLVFKDADGKVFQFDHKWEEDAEDHSKDVPPHTDFSVSETLDAQSYFAGYHDAVKDAEQKTLDSIFPSCNFIPAAVRDYFLEGGKPKVGTEIYQSNDYLNNIRTSLVFNNSLHRAAYVRENLSAGASDDAAPSQMDPWIEAKIYENVHLERISHTEQRDVFEVYTSCKSKSGANILYSPYLKIFILTQNSPNAFKVFTPDEYERWLYGAAHER